MDLRIIFPVLSMLSSGIFDFVAAASLRHFTAADASVSARHSRTKRCSCASFLDKECVYFCHLDIIWVNTPERTVSYGLGNAERKKRSVAEAVVPKTRCRCSDSKDKTCSSFCQPNKRVKNTQQIGDALLRLRATKKIQLFLKSWRVTHHRTHGAWLKTSRRPTFLINFTDSD